eukprot:4076755-Alexandrium_andersonii.AAC.1
MSCVRRSAPSRSARARGVGVPIARRHSAAPGSCVLPLLPAPRAERSHSRAPPPPAWVALTVSVS